MTLFVCFHIFQSFYRLFTIPMEIQARLITPRMPGIFYIILESKRLEAEHSVSRILMLLRASRAIAAAAALMPLTFLLFSTFLSQTNLQRNSPDSTKSLSQELGQENLLGIILKMRLKKKEKRKIKMELVEFNSTSSPFFFLLFRSFRLVHHFTLEKDRFKRIHENIIFPVLLFFRFSFFSSSFSISWQNRILP